MNGHGKRLLSAIAVWIVASALVGGGTALVIQALAGREAPALGPVLVAEVYALLLASLVVVFRTEFREVVAARAFAAKDVALAAAACAAAYLVVGPAEALLGARFWASTVTILWGIGSDGGRLASAGPLLAGVILIRACVLAPLAEEFFFRGALYGWVRRRVTPQAAICMTAAAFAAIHGFPAILPLAFVLGLALGWVRERTGSTWPTVLVHALHNSLLVALSYGLTGWTGRLPQWGSW